MVSQKTIDLIQKAGIGISLLGLFAILQPFSMLLYRFGFQILCIGGFMYIALNYVPAGAPISKSTVLILSVLGVVVGFLLLGIVLAPTLVGS